MGENESNEERGGDRRAPAQGRRESWEAFTRRTLEQLARVDDLERSMDDADATRDVGRRRGKEGGGLTQQHARLGVHGLSPGLAAILTPPRVRGRAADADEAGGGVDRVMFEAILRERDEEHARSQRHHREIVLRLQRDHAASEATFHSIVAHLEDQLQQAVASAASLAADTHAHADSFRVELTAERQKMAAKHDADLDALRQAHAREVYMLRTECTARVSAEERDRHDAANAVATAKNELATTKLEAAHLAEDVDQLRAEAASAMAAAAAATEAAEAAHREAAQLRSSNERYRAESIDVEKQAGTMLEEMQQTNEALVRDTAASLARAEAGSLQRIKAKDSEIHALQQLVLQTKQDAAEKIKAAIEDYQSRTFNVEERIKKTKAEVQAEADTAAAALRRELTEATDERDVAVAEVAVCRKAAETAVDTLKKRHQQELDDAVRGCETTAWERQMVSDEQHKLEIERFRAAAEHCQRELTRHDRALHGDMARLHELHQNELETQETAFAKEMGVLSDKLKQRSSALVKVKDQLQQTEEAKRVQTRDLELLLQRERADREAALDRAARTVGLEADRRVQRAATKHASVLDSVTRDLQAAQNERAAADAAQIERLSTEVAEIKRELATTRDARDRAFTDARTAHQAEVAQMTDRHHADLSDLRNELEQTHQHSENAVQRVQGDHETAIEHLHVQFAEQMRGMLPADVRDDLESTIASLRSQSELLEQRSALLQDRLNTSNHRPSTSSGWQ
eukprot:m.82133 g.82133  ORF g.82133 m.82133 type:complete len:747 (-) comp19537_c1_seq1:91-2331(-)